MISTSLTGLLIADEQVVEQIVQISTDGRNYTPINQSPAAARSFAYKPSVTTTVLYRIKVTFDVVIYYFQMLLHCPLQVMV